MWYSIAVGHDVNLLMLTELGRIKLTVENSSVSREVNLNKSISKQSADLSSDYHHMESRVTKHAENQPIA